MFDKKITFNNFLCNEFSNDYYFPPQSYEELINNAAKIIKSADYILVGAGAGLSASAGIKYSGKEFEENFQDFVKKYGITDMYSGGFYPYPDEETKWGYWSKQALVGGVDLQPTPLYSRIFNFLKDKSYFILTTNADLQFNKAGIPDERIFATQGLYSLIQCKKACHNKTYSAEKLFLKMNQARRDCRVPSYMVPKCPVCGGKMEMNLRCDNYFVEDSNWHKAEENFGNFLFKCLSNKDKKVVLLELGVGFNTPIIIRFPFEKLVRENKNISLIRLNLSDSAVPQSLGSRAIGINADIAKSITDIMEKL